MVKNITGIHLVLTFVGDRKESLMGAGHGRGERVRQNEIQIQDRR
jgi:hypothetical protein